MGLKKGDRVRSKEGVVTGSGFGRGAYLVQIGDRAAFQFFEDELEVVGPSVTTETIPGEEYYPTEGDDITVSYRGNVRRESGEWVIHTKSGPVHSHSVEDFVGYDIQIHKRGEKKYTPRQKAAAAALVDLARRSGEPIEQWIRDLAAQS